MRPKGELISLRSHQAVTTNRWRRERQELSQRRLAALRRGSALGENLLRFLLESAHRVDERNRTVADARDTEIRQAIIRWHAVHDHDVDGHRDALADSPDERIVGQAGNEEAGGAVA
jgi:hypothetical protein